MAAPMPSESPCTEPRGTSLPTLPFYYGWINVLVASIGMTATLPGRTFGLGLITEPLLISLRIDHVWFSRVNFLASVVGAAFCLPIGWLIDRYGVRMVLTGVMAALGLSVVWMSGVVGPVSLLAAMVLVRGFGQSALSVVSMAAISKWFRRRLGLAMGLFAVLMTIGMGASIALLGPAIKHYGWSGPWHAVGLVLLALTPIVWLLARSTPESVGLGLDDAPRAEQPPADSIAPHESSYRLVQALTTPAFWAVALGTSAFNLVFSGITLFNESMLAERGLGQEAAVQIVIIMTLVGLLANLLGGALATKARVLKLLGVGLALLTASLILFPRIESLGGARLYAAAVGISGGIVTVVFFAAWGHLFGRAQLGRIQGAAQVATVLASALGPVLIAESHERSGSYAAGCYWLACGVALLAVLALVVPAPREP